MTYIELLLAVFEQIVSRKELRVGKGCWCSSIDNVYKESGELQGKTTGRVDTEIEKVSVT